ncbi:MAG: modified peptide precursor CbpA [Planctomycetes bacterium]|nr:modified peptide precursor CbpA [Planctomycetota bacterium]
MKTGKKKQNPDIISVRKSCNADGTGLSHYILMDKKAKK